MLTAFILINVEAGAEAEVLKALKRIKHILEAYTVYGVYDIVAKIKADSMNELEDVNWEIRNLDKVSSTRCLIAIKSV